jgi:hypothetical protein
MRTVDADEIGAQPGGDPAAIVEADGAGGR